MIRRSPSTLVRTIGLGAIDQGLFSLGNMLFYVALGRIATIEEFGLVAAAVLAYESLLLAVQSVFVQSPSLLLPEVEQHEQASLVSTALAFALAVGLVSCVVVISIGVVLDQSLLVVAGAVFAPLFAQEAARSLAFALRRPALAVLNDGVWTGIQIAVFVVSLVWSLSPEAIVVWWALGALAGAVCGVASLGLGLPRPSKVALGRLLRGTGSLTKENLLSAAQTHSIGWMVLVVAGPVGAGALRGVRTLFGPSNAMIAGMRSAGVPIMRGAASTGDLDGLRSPARRLLLVMVSAVSATGAAVLLLPERWGQVLLGDVFDEAVHLTPAFLAISLLRVPIVVGQMILLARRRVDALVAVRLRLTAVTVVGVALGVTLGGVNGAIVGGAIATALVLPSWRNTVSDALGLGQRNEALSIRET
ncbi:MAG: hypothetical protein R2733_26765 [Acidimicrobiales bacterium]